MSLTPVSRLDGRAYRLLAALTSLLLMTAAACALKPRPAPSCDDPRASECATQTTFHHELMIEGVPREVIVYVPESAPEAGAPAVFMFHGGSGTGEKFYRISGWRQKANQVGLIAVFPTALVHCFFDTKDGEYKAFTSWSNGKFGKQYILCDEDQLDRLPPRIREAADHPEADDIAFVHAIIDLLIDEYGVDANRVYSAGFSNGAGFSARIGLELSDRIAAFAMASSRVNVESIATRPISAVMHFGGEETGFPADETVWDVPDYREAIETALGGLQLDTLYTYDERIIGGVKVSRQTFETSAVGAANSLQALVIDSLPHVYPNGRNHPIRMAELHWNFFSKHSLAEGQAARAGGR